MPRNKGSRNNFYKQSRIGGLLPASNETSVSSYEKKSVEAKKELHTNLTTSPEPDMSNRELVVDTELFEKVGLPVVTTNFPLQRIKTFFALLAELALLDEDALSDESHCKIFFKLYETNPPRVNKLSFLQIISADGKKTEEMPAILFLTMLPLQVKREYSEFKNDYFTLIRALLTSRGLPIHGIKQLGTKFR